MHNMSTCITRIHVGLGCGTSRRLSTVMYPEPQRGFGAAVFARRRLRASTGPADRAVRRSERERALASAVPTVHVELLEGCLASEFGNELGTEGTEVAQSLDGLRWFWAAAPHALSFGN